MLRPLADSLWIHERNVTLPGGILLPTSSTVLRLEDGTLALHSPPPLDDDGAQEIAALGDVSTLIAPNYFHWMSIGAAKARYPEARVLATPRLEKKLAGVAFEPLPERGAIAGLPELHVECVQGAPYVHEHAIFHERTRTLVVTDLLVNVHACQSFLLKLVLRCAGLWQKTGQGPEWRFLVKDRAAAARSADAILGLDFARIVVAHGEVVDVDAPEQARRALGWMLRGAPSLLRTRDAGAR